MGFNCASLDSHTPKLLGHSMVSTVQPRIQKGPPHMDTYETRLQPKFRKLWNHKTNHLTSSSHKKKIIKIINK